MIVQTQTPYSCFWISQEKNTIQVVSAKDYRHLCLQRNFMILFVTRQSFFRNTCACGFAGCVLLPNPIWADRCSTVNAHFRNENGRSTIELSYEKLWLTLCLQDKKKYEPLVIIVAVTVAGNCGDSRWQLW